MKMLPSSIRRVALLCALPCVFAVPATRSMHAQMSMAGMETVEIPPPAQLPPAVRMTGIGNSHLTVTANAEAQAWFDQGLNLMHDFWDYESARAFQQGIRADPKCAMCYWGLYQELTSTHRTIDTYAHAALAEAVRLRPHVSDSDQMYIDAAVAEDKAGEKDGPAAEIVILRKLIRTHPDDLQAKILLEGALHDGYNEDGTPRKGTAEAITILQEALAKNPNDSALNHYWIHLVEPGPHPEQALASARLLASLAPASGHMVHMPGHIFYLVGDYAGAEHWFDASTGVDEAYMQSQHVAADDDWNYVHNLMYAIANLMEQGKLQQAATVTGKLAGARGRLQSTLYTQAPRDGMTRLAPRLPIAMRTGDWPAVQDMLKTAKPDARLQNLIFLAGELRLFAAGMQAVESGNLAQAQASSTELDAALWRISQKPRDKNAKAKEPESTPVKAVVMADAMLPPVVASLSIMSMELRGCILATQHRLPEAEALFSQARVAEKELGYREPPTFIRPVSETEGAALLQAKDYAAAHKAFQAAVVERPRSGFGLYGMAQSSEQAGDNSTARAEYATFISAWKDADAALPQVTHARAYLASTHVAMK